jgi:hypothetical protein
MKRNSIVRALAVSAGALALPMMVQVASATHPRPVGASPMRISLVPAYAPCTAPNRAHGPPLAFASCNPPAQTSAQATVGTPDAFGGGANSVSHLRLESFICQGHCFPGDSDIRIDIALHDVRCVPTGARCGTANASGPADYSGELRLSFTARLTDHYNATAPGGGTEAATVEDFTIDEALAANWGTAIAWACVQSGSTSIGSTCNLSTSLDAYMPLGGTRESRQIWALDAVRIYDGGPDGDGDTVADNTVFVRPGIFVP